jgi:hypothetical protein
VQDAGGDVVALCDLANGDGRVVGQFTYDPYGEPDLPPFSVPPL